MDSKDQKIILPDPDQAYELFEKQPQNTSFYDLTQEINTHVKRLQRFVLNAKLYQVIPDGGTYTDKNGNKFPSKAISYQIVEFAKKDQTKPKIFIQEIPANAFHSGTATANRFRENVADYFFNDSSIDLSDYRFIAREIVNQDSNEVNIFVTKSAKNIAKLRWLNQVLGGYSAEEHLTKLGYRKVEIAPGQFEFIKDIFPKEKMEETDDFDYKAWVDYYIDLIDGSEKPSYVSKYSLNITYQEIIEIIKNPKNIEAIRENIVAYLRWKQQRYIERLKGIGAAIDYESVTFRAAGLTDKEKEILSTVLSNKMAKAYLKESIECIQKKIPEIQNISQKDLINDYLAAVELIDNLNEEEIKQVLYTLIKTLIRGYQGFSSDYLNTSIVGPAGVGKTTLGKIIGEVYTKMHILCNGIVRVSSRSDLIAGFLGQTAGKTKTGLYASLEGILFIDEAYQLAGCPEPDKYGQEAITEIVNFLSEYIGCSIIIVAGYEEEMKKCFFARNEGLTRRFPINFVLKSYEPITLLKVLLYDLLKNMGENIFEGNQKEDIEYVEMIYQGIQVFDEQNLFPNAGGDIQILAGLILKKLLSSGDLEIGIKAGFYDYAKSVKGLTPQQADQLVDEF